MITLQDFHRRSKISIGNSMIDIGMNDNKFYRMEARVQISSIHTSLEILGQERWAYQIMDCNRIKSVYVVNMQMQLLLFCSYFRKN